MDKLCLKKDDHDEDSYYIKGYNINYNSGSSNSINSSSSQFINMVFDKSTTSSKAPEIERNFNELYKVGDNDGVSPGNGKNFKQVNKVGDNGVVSPDVIKERCRIAYECRNNMMCIEGNRPRNKK